jgi:chorismate dehydratase
MTRIGMVKYINTAPIYEVWKAEVKQPDWQVVEASPSSLNRMLAADKLDLGFVSSYEYCARPHKYKILSDLSISATGPVGSVFLFTKRPVRELHGEQILITGQSDTSVCLLKIILEEFLGIQPGGYERAELFGEHERLNSFPGVMAIGDEALRIHGEKRYPVQLDLADFWHQQTGLPFVFAVFAIREEFLKEHGDEACRIHQALLSCKEKGLTRLPEISSRIARRIPMDRDACLHYLSSMEYDLSEKKQQALTRFFSYLIQRGEADAAALPLKIFSS